MSTDRKALSGILPGSAKTLTHILDQFEQTQAAADNSPLPKGVYTAEAWLTTEGATLYRAQVAFEIRPGK